MNSVKRPSRVPNPRAATTTSPRAATACARRARLAARARGPFFFLFRRGVPAGAGRLWSLSAVGFLRPRLRSQLLDSVTSEDRRPPS